VLSAVLRRSLAAPVAALVVGFAAQPSGAQQAGPTYNPNYSAPAQPTLRTQASAQPAAPAAPTVVAPVVNNTAYPGSFGGYVGYQGPYYGYLSGAAEVTNANAQYQLTIQQASQAREQARQSAVQTRRMTREERQYELATTPTSEDIRQQEMMNSLRRSRSNPPAMDVWTGRALNDLLRAIQGAQVRGAQGPPVPLPEGSLRHINFTTGTTYGGLGLLKDGGKLEWPLVLKSDTFKAERQRIDELTVQAARQAYSGPVSDTVQTDLIEAIDGLESAVNRRVVDLTPTQFVQAMRYVRELKEASRVVQDPKVSANFQGSRSVQADTVGQLVQQMTTKGLTFAPAVSGDEAAYNSLYPALLQYDYAVNGRR
jgi:hypothetical protein